VYDDMEFREFDEIDEATETYMSREEIERLYHKFGIDRHASGGMKFSRPLFSLEELMEEPELKDNDNSALEETYDELFFYFSNQETFEKYTREVGRTMGIRNEDLDELAKNLEQQISQSTKKTLGNICINTRTWRVKGDHLFQMNKTIGKTLRDMEGLVSKVTGWNGQGGIDNPRFPQGENLEIAVARLAATILSDCTIEPNGVIKYAESDKRRIERVIENLQMFGDISPSSTLIESENHYITHFPFVIGKLMIQRGIPYGDRTIQNPRLIPCVRNGSGEVQRAYTEDFITQDGCIGDHSVIWRRACALNAGEKAEKYDFEEKLELDEIRVIVDYGRREEGNAKAWSLSWGRLVDLVGQSAEKISRITEKVMQTILKNPNRLIHDEVDIVKSFGVNVNVKPSEIKYYPKTNRVTTIWQAYTIGRKEAIKFGIVAQPNDEIKSAKMKRMISNHDVERRAALIELKQNNTRFVKWWEK
jgi:hypothetical protein